MNSHSIMSSPNSCNSVCLSPFNIKRKCLSSSLMLNNPAATASPSYSISSINLSGAQISSATNSLSSATNNSTSPSNHLNDSFDENISCKRYMYSASQHGRRNQHNQNRTTPTAFNHLSIRRKSASTLFARYKSEPPLNSMNSNTSLDDSFKQQQQQQQQQQPLNDISNLLQLKHKTSSANDSITTEMDTDVNDLENLIYGNSENSNNNNNLTTTQQQQLIKQSLEIDANCHGQLIGDRTKKHILPTIISSKHQDLHCISPNTLVEVLDGAYNNQIDECIVIDSRYPYEYEAGHIRDAKNIFTKQKLYEEFFIKRHSHLKNDLNQDVLIEHDDDDDEFGKRIIIIFHCEFSSERGPSLLKFLRNQDRTINDLHYPNLFYPELYLLEGGYKSFYFNFKNYCEPQDYKPMLHEAHLNELRHFRAKAKSWSNEPSRHITLFHFEQQHQQQHQQSTSDQIDSPNKHRLVKMKAFY